MRNTSVVALLVVTAVLHFARDVLIPLALAILLSFLLAPAVRRLERRKLGRVASTLFAQRASTSSQPGSPRRPTSCASSPFP